MTIKKNYPDKPYPDEWTPEERALADALKKVYANDDSKPSRPLDLSFMHEKPVCKKKK